MPVLRNAGNKIWWKGGGEENNDSGRINSNKGIGVGLLRSKWKFRVHDMRSFDVVNRPAMMDDMPLAPTTRQKSDTATRLADAGWLGLAGLVS